MTPRTVLDFIGNLRKDSMRFREWRRPAPLTPCHSAARSPGHSLLKDDNHLTCLSGVEYQIVTPDFFHTVGIPLVKGRVFTEQDGKETMPVGVINEAMARLYWPNEDPIGKRLRVQAPIRMALWATIVGIVGDIKAWIVTRRPLSTDHISSTREEI
jgi:hypothetical protein